MSSVLGNWFWGVYIVSRDTSVGLVYKPVYFVDVEKMTATKTPPIDIGCSQASHGARPILVYGSVSVRPSLLRLVSHAGPNDWRSLSAY